MIGVYTYIGEKHALHDNHRAGNLYERLGFVLTDTLEDHFLMEID